MNQIQRPVEERLKQQEQQIRDLQERLQQVESSTMSEGSREGSEDAIEPTNDVCDRRGKLGLTRHREPE